MSAARYVAFIVASALLLLTPRAVCARAPDFSARTGTHVALATADDAEPKSQGESASPWQFFRENVEHADSLVKRLALISFTILLIGTYVPLVLPGIVVVVGVLAFVKPNVRSSRLVRAGFAILLLGLVPLVSAGLFITDNPLGFGFLFAFLNPIAAVTMTLGAVLALLKNDKALNQDIAALVAAAKSSRPVWPDEPPLPQVDRVATRGPRAGPALVFLLGSVLDDQSNDTSWNVHVEQQAELALCKIYHVLPTAGQTVYDMQSTREGNSLVRTFWRSKVRATTTSS